MRPACRLYSPVRTVRTCAVPTFILPPGLLLRMVTDAAHRIDTLSSLFFLFRRPFYFCYLFPSGVPKGDYLQGTPNSDFMLW